MKNNTSDVDKDFDKTSVEGGERLFGDISLSSFSFFETI